MKHVRQRLEAIRFETGLYVIIMALPRWVQRAFLSGCLGNFKAVLV